MLHVSNRKARNAQSNTPTVSFVMNDLITVLTSGFTSYFKRYAWYVITNTRLCKLTFEKLLGAKLSCLIHSLRKIDQTF